jgi:metallo-beta-lactamase class B
MKKLLLAAAISCAAYATEATSYAETPAASPWALANPDWVEAVEPFRIHDNIYFVGTRGLSSFLITTPEGHFLLDGGMPENASVIAQNIATLGFDVLDVKFLLNSHAHFDHSGGLAALKAISGATMVASEGDRSALEGGFYLGSESDAELRAPPVKVDRIIADGEDLSLGGVTLTAHLTPGHTKGCTSWTMNSRGLEVLFFCSATVAANRLVNPPQYEGIVEDYRSTFAKLKNWRPDIFLANHPSVSGIEERRVRQLAGDERAFIDRESFPVVVQMLEAAFERALAEQTAGARSE